jgi:hypothetical protein
VLRLNPDLSFQVEIVEPLVGAVPLLFGSFASNHNCSPEIKDGLKIIGGGKIKIYIFNNGKCLRHIL